MSAIVLTWYWSIWTGLDWTGLDWRILRTVFALVGVVVGHDMPWLHAMVALELGAELGLSGLSVAIAEEARRRTYSS